MATLVVQQINASGIVPSFVAAAAGGDKFPPGDDVEFEVVNGGGGSITVTIASQKTCNQGATHDGGGAVAAGARKRFGPFPSARWAGADGLVAVTYSGVTTVTVAAFRR